MEDIKFRDFVVIIFIIIGGTYCVSRIFYNVIIPTLIEKRAKELNLMQYDSKSDKFVFKDSITINSGDLYYLQYGTTKGYKNKINNN